MSLKTFIAAAGAAISKLATKVETFFEGAATVLETEVIPVAITITNALKDVVTFDSGDIIGSIIGKVGAHLEDVLREILPEVYTDLTIAQSLEGKTVAEVEAIIVPILAGPQSDLRTKLLAEFEATVAVKLAAKKGIGLSIIESIQLGQLAYHDIEVVAEEAASVAPGVVESAVVPAPVNKAAEEANTALPPVE